MKLYELTEDFQTLFDSLEDISSVDMDDESREQAEQAWFEALECVEAAFADKAENVAAYIKQISAEADMLAAEEKSLRARRAQKEKRAKRLKAYLLESMQNVKLTKIDAPMAKITVRNNAESAVIDDERAFIEWAQRGHDELLRHKTPEIDRAEVKRFLQAGGSIPGAALGRTKSIVIK